MGQISTRLPCFCLNWAVSGGGARPLPENLTKSISSNVVETASVSELFGNRERHFYDGTKLRRKVGRRIMIVVDSSPEAKGALQWALSHTVHSHDTVLLLHVAKPSSHDEKHHRVINSRGYEVLFAMKNTCFVTRPDVHVEIKFIEGKEKGPAIVEEARKQGASLLIMGGRKRSVTWQQMARWAGARIGSGAMDYCIQNADCLTLAVRRKSRKHGGYLITSRRHKDFWLLA